MSMQSQDDLMENLSREEFLSALFANMVFQNTNMTLMMLGKVPHPETGEKVTDLEAARMFIDQLEMLAVKTKGNLSKEEEHLLQQSLTHVRLQFVEAAGQAARGSQAPESADPTISSPGEGPAVEPESESRKRFSKKY